MKRKLPIGVSDFNKLISEGYYFVDKSLFIKDIVQDGAEVILIPRPRRFGKTLNMSMLKCFFEKAEENTSKLFQGLFIYEHSDIMERQGKYPVIYISFKDEKYSSWENCEKGLTILISNIYRKFIYLLDGDILDESIKKKYIDILNEKADIVELSKSLAALSEYLYKYHKEKVVILIDEYDVPIQEGYMKEYYDKVIEFMRNFLSGALKDNVYLEKAVLTGILRVAKESIFSGLNNLEVCSILNKRYSQYFGFLEAEVEEILKYYNIEYTMDEIRKWYNGYTFGNNVIYNPWSILNYVKNSEVGYKPYWVNTAESSLIKMLLAKGDEEVKKELESLVKSEELIKMINENIVMNEVDKNTSNLWSFLLFSGYLNAESWELKEGVTYCSLKIPNLEVKSLYNQIILSWFNDNVSSDKFNLMLKSLLLEDMETFEDILSEFIIKTASYFDISKESEKFYHAFVLGMLIALNGKYEIKSNRESGFGRYDILLVPKDRKEKGFVIEFKKVNERRKETLESAIESAIKQIEDKNYSMELIDLGIKEISLIGIAFEGKEVLVRKA